ncbi:MAG: DUF1003 domain-containing protein [Polyangiales bacterium]
MTTNAEMLAEVPIFALLDDQERAVLAERLDVETHKEGHKLFDRGDPGDALYVVREGEVEIWVKNDTGERMVLETCKRGDFFGEISLLDGGPRTAGAVTKTSVELLVVDRGDLEELIRLKPQAAMDLLSAAGRRLRGSADILRRTVSRNVNEEVADTRSTVMKVADWISEFSGSLSFLFLHLGIFFLWIILNSGPLSKLPGIGGFDPFPYGLLTMVVSLEAIVLSVFVLLSQSRQVARDRIRSDIEYQVNVRAELEIMHLHEKVDQLHEALTKRLATLEKTTRGGPSVGG